MQFHGSMCDGILMLTGEKPGHSEGLEAPEDGEECPPATWETEVWQKRECERGTCNCKRNNRVPAT